MGNRWREYNNSCVWENYRRNDVERWDHHEGEQWRDLYLRQNREDWDNCRRNDVRRWDSHKGEQWKDPYLRQDRGNWDRYREWHRMKEGNRRHDVFSWSQKLKSANF